MAMKKREKNKGFSLIEIIIVIAILAILSSGVVVAFNRIGYANTMKTANRINIALSKLRIETMTKATKPYLYLYKRGNSTYFKVSKKDNAADANLDTLSGQKIAEGSILSFKKTSGVEEILIDTMCISFERSSGAFSSDYEYITIANGSNKKTIYCIEETGRHWIE